MNILFHTAVGVSDYCHTVGVTVIFNLAFPTDKFISYVLQIAVDKHTYGKLQAQADIKLQITDNDSGG